MLLHRLHGGPLGPAVYALPVLEDDEVQVLEESLEVDEEVLLVGDEEAMDLLHVCHALGEACRGLRAE